MGIIDSFGCVRISRYKPRIRVRIGGTCGLAPTVEGEIELHIARVGDTTTGEFVTYTPLEQSGEWLTFQFDETLFVKTSGRYTGRLVVDGNDCSTICLQYENNNCHSVVVELDKGCGPC